MKSDRIKNWPKQERPREKLIAEGAEKQTDANLLAVILRVGRGTFKKGEPGQSAQALAHALLDEAWTDEAGQKADALTRELRIALRKVDRSHNAALWREVREIFDYPVFSAAPDAVGITSTGADGPNRLPEVLAAYRRFEAWVAAGAKPEDAPAFEAGRLGE